MAKIVKLSPADLGELGETDFKRWCTLGGLVATKAMPDRMGWDFFVERDPLAKSQENGIPLDQRYSFHKSFVQIKSSQSNRTRVRCKLSAALRLATAILPSFFICFVYNNDGIMTNAYGLHLKSAEIDRILKRVREAEHSGDAEIDKKYIEFNTASMRPLMISGSDINEFLFNDINNIMDYLNNKYTNITTSGHDEKSITGRIKFLSGVSIEDLVDLSIGLKSDIEIDQMTIEKRRFGILLPGDTEIIGPGKLSIKPNNDQKVTMHVYSKKAGRRAGVELGVISPAIPDLNPDHLKFRLTNEFIEAIIAPAKGEFTFTIKPDTDKKYEVNDAVNVLNFVSILSYDDAFAQFNDGALLNTEEKIMESRDVPRISEYLYFLSNHVLSAASRLSVTNLLKVSISDIESAFISQPTMMSILLKEGIEITIRVDSSQKIETDNFRVVFPFCVSFPNFCYFGASIAEAVRMGGSEGEIRIKTVRTRVEQDSIDLTGDNCAAGANDLARSVASRLQPAGGCLITMDLKSDPSSEAG